MIFLIINDIRIQQKDPTQNLGEEYAGMNGKLSLYRPRFCV